MPDLQYMWYGTKPSLTFNTSSVTQTEDFEDDTYNSFFTITNPSSMSGTEAGWQRTTAKSYTGTGSFKNQTLTEISGVVQEARVDFTFTIPPYAKNIRIEYRYLQDCEEGFDGLKVYLDDTLIHNYITNGTYLAWTLGSITTSVTGTRKLTFEFRKDGQTTKYTDSVYIDDLKVTYDIDVLAETPGTEIIRFDGSTGYSLLYHRVGAQAPPLVFIEQRVPFQPGSMLQYTDILPRDVELGILVKGTSKSDLRDKVRNLANKIINVDGVLYAKYIDGTERRLYCRYMAGMEGEEKPETMGRGYFQKMILVFRAFDPFWYVTEVTGYEHYALMNKDYDGNGVADGYSSNSSGTITVTRSLDTKEGAQKIDVTSSGSAGAWASVYREISVTAGKAYSFGVDVKTGTGTVEGRFYISWYNDSGPLNQFSTYTYVPPNTDWNTYKVSNQVAPSGATRARFYFQAYCRNGGETGPVWFKNAQFEEGTTATDFTTNPKKNLLIPTFSYSNTDNFNVLVSNFGAYDMYPVIYVDGPASNPDIVVYKSGTTEPSSGSGKRLKINYSVPAGKKLIVNMKKRTVKLDDGTNLYDKIDSVDNFFASIPNDGESYNIDVDHSGAFGSVRFHVYAEEPHWGV